MWPFRGNIKLGEGQRLKIIVDDKGVQIKSNLNEAAMVLILFDLMITMRDRAKKNIKNPS